MTIHDIATQLHGIAVGGCINGERFTAKRLENWLHVMFDKGMPKAKVIMSIALPDGDWFMSVYRFNESRDGFDYEIPDTRTREEVLWGESVQ